MYAYIIVTIPVNSEFAVLTEEFYFQTDLQMICKPEMHLGIRCWIFLFLFCWKVCIWISVYETPSMLDESFCDLIQIPVRSPPNYWTFSPKLVGSGLMFFNRATTWGRFYSSTCFLRLDLTLIQLKQNKIYHTCLLEIL